MDDTQSHAILKEQSGEQLDDTSAITENIEESDINDHSVLIKNSSFLNIPQQIDKNEDKNINQGDML